GLAQQLSTAFRNIDSGFRRRAERPKLETGWFIPIPELRPKHNTLSLHDALPISIKHRDRTNRHDIDGTIDRENEPVGRFDRVPEDRKSTRLNSSHRTTSYAVFCLKKKKTIASCRLMVSCGVCPTAALAGLRIHQM